MTHPFFPVPWFAWGFCGLLVALMTAAAVTDSRRLIIPKWVTLPMLGLGLLANVIRAGWLGSEGMALHYLSTGSVAAGAADGLLFALAGFGVGFGLLFVLWILGTCGGGDVKLFAAVGAWMGPRDVLVVWAVSVGALLLVTLIRLLTVGITPSTMEQIKNAKNQKKTDGTLVHKPKIRLSYALPVLIAGLAVLYWRFGNELGLAATGA